MAWCVGRSAWQGGLFWMQAPPGPGISSCSSTTQLSGISPACEPVTCVVPEQNTSFLIAHTESP